MLYPDHLHDAHRDFPLAPQQLEISRDMLSPEMQRFLLTHEIVFSKQTRLTQTLLPKEGYVTHIKNLKFYQNEGMVITKIRRGIKFYQSAWMREYIQINTLRRIDSRSKFEKDFFKLLVSHHLLVCSPEVSLTTSSMLASFTIKFSDKFDIRENLREC